MENFAKLVPGVIDQAPAEVMKLQYGETSVQPGNPMTPTQVKAQPEVGWQADPSKFYLLCMTDPDNVPVEQRDTPNSQWHHWLVGNIPGADIQKGDILSEYIGSGPPEGTGPHRYCFLVYEQHGKQEFGCPRLGQACSGRSDFDIRDFVKKNDIGALVAANFYMAEFDDWVPHLYEKLGP
jgi:hypothetical protein